MTNILLVGMGGFVGSVLRYWLFDLLRGVGRVPAGTLVVNTVGCLMIGLFGGWADNHDLLSQPARLFLMIGILGGFTTFSAFGYETMGLARNGEFLGAMLNVMLHVLLGLIAVWIGLRLSLIRA